MSELRHEFEGPERLRDWHHVTGVPNHCVGQPAALVHIPSQFCAPPAGVPHPKVFALRLGELPAAAPVKTVDDPGNAKAGITGEY